jgi:hypothetical protein
MQQRWRHDILQIDTRRNDIQHSRLNDGSQDKQHTALCYAERRYAECCIFIVILSLLSPLFL